MLPPLLFLAAWLWGSPEAREFAGWRMKTNTSVSLIMASLALIVLATAYPRKRPLAFVLAATTMAIGLATGIEYAFGLNLGIDELIAKDFPFAESARFPNRMAPNAAVSMIVIGLGLIGARSERRQLALAAQILATLVLVISAFALLGYLYGVTALYKPTPFLRISPYTATSLVLLALGTLALRPELPISARFVGTGTGHILTRMLLPITVFLPVVLGWFALRGVRGEVDDATVMTLHVVSVVAVLTAVVLFLAARLDAIDTRRGALERMLRQSNELSSALARAASVGDVARVATELGPSLLGASGGGVLIRRSDHLELVSARGYDDRVLDAYRAFPLDAPFPAADAARNEEPVFIESPAEYAERYPSVPKSDYAKNGAWAALPLESRGRIIGALTLSFREPRELDRATRAELGRIAGQYAQALDRALLFESEREARERVNAASAAGYVGTWVWLVDEDVLHADEVLAALFGIPKDSLADGMPLSELVSRIHPDDRERVSAAIFGAVETGDDYRQEYRVVRPDGSVRWVAARGRCQPEPSGTKLFPGALMDVTERRLAEQEREEARTELAATTERLQAVLDAATIGTYVWDTRSGRVEHDRGVKRIFGFAENEGNALEDYSGRVHPDDRAEWHASLERVAVESESFELRYRIVLPNGEVRWLLDKGYVARDEAAHVMLTGAVVDLTPEHSARAQAESANRAKDQFLAMLGHELRNPLSPIVTSLELMKMRGSDQLVKERDVIERQVRHMIRLVDDLLDVSRITRGKVQLRRRKLEIAEIVANAIEVVLPVLEQRMHRLEVSVSSTGLVVDGDPARLTQVFSNLLTNAARYTEPDGRISVTARRSGDDVVVEVSDSGVGIPAELVPRVFDIFVQGGRTIERSQGGLGLGLAIVKSLVELHGGRVSVRSDGPGKGSVFSIALPAQAALAPSEAARERSAPAAPAPSSRVVVVDDNRDAAEMLSFALSAAGHQVKTAFDGPSALEVVTEHRPALVFLDIGLPVMDGYEVARRIRSTSEGRAMVLVAMTGYGQDSDKQRAVEAGFDRHLVKPVTLETSLALAADVARRAPAPPP